MAESASSTRAVASRRSILLVSPDPIGARSLQKKPCLRNPSGNGNTRVVARCLAYYSYHGVESKRNLGRENPGLLNLGPPGWPRASLQASSSRLSQFGCALELAASCIDVP